MECLANGPSTLFGGPAQPTPIDERGGIRAAARKDAESESVCSPNQYVNDDVGNLFFGHGDDTNVVAF